MILTKEEIGNKSVIIIGPPRSGSTITVSQIGKELNLPVFNDITYQSPSIKEELFSRMSVTEQFVLKFHPIDLPFYPIELIKKIKNNKTYNVKLVRENVYKWAASVYIAWKREKYSYNINDKEKFDDDIQINFIKLTQSLGMVYNSLKDLDNIDIRFDKELVYEELKFDALLEKTPLPKNYNELVFFLEKFDKLQKFIKEIKCREF